VDDEVGDEVGVLAGCGGFERVGDVEVACERGERERGGAAMGEQEVEGAQGYRAGSPVVGAVVEQPADRREGGFYVGQVA
jgi:hypothetical protein